MGEGSIVKMRVRKNEVKAEIYEPTRTDNSAPSFKIKARPLEAFCKFLDIMQEAYGYSKEELEDAQRKYQDKKKY